MAKARVVPVDDAWVFGPVLLRWPLAGAAFRQPRLVPCRILIAGTFWVVAGTPWTLQTIWDEP